MGHVLRLLNIRHLSIGFGYAVAGITTVAMLATRVDGRSLGESVLEECCCRWAGSRQWFRLLNADLLMAMYDNRGKSKGGSLLRWRYTLKNWRNAETK